MRKSGSKSKKSKTSSSLQNSIQKNDSTIESTSDKYERPALCGFAYGQIDRMRKENLFDFNQMINASFSLFSIFNLAKIFNEQKDYSSMKKAQFLFLLSSLISSIAVIISDAAAIYFGTLKFNIESTLLDSNKTSLDFSPLITVSLYMIFFYTPLSFIANIFCEEILYRLFSITGGFGTRNQQYYLSSLILLALSFSTLTIILFQIPVFDIIAIFIFLISFFYLLFYVFQKMYSSLHRVHFFHALIFNIIIRGIIMILVLYIANSVSSILNIPKLIGG